MDYASDKGLRIKTEEFTRCMRELRTRLGTIQRTLQQVIDPEVAKVLEKSLALTNKASEIKIRERVKNRQVFMIDNKRIDMRWWPYLRRRDGAMMTMPADLQAQVEVKRARILRHKIAAIGLTKNSWWLLSRKLGIPINAPAFVQTAKTNNPAGMENNVAITRSGNGNSYGVKVENYMPILRWTNGTQAFFSALAGRIGFFRMNVKKGVFNDIANVAKKYPGIMVQE
jgi:hypothetical protein